VRPGYIKIYWRWGLLLGIVSTSVSSEGLLTLKVENDLFSAGGDGHYTNGIEGVWAVEPADRHWSRRFAEVLPGWSASSLVGEASRCTRQKILKPKH
jgi:hypothetical protein